MAQEHESVALLLYNDSTALVQGLTEEEFPGAAEGLRKYADLVRDVLLQLCGYREFSHLEFLEVSTSYKAGETSSPLAIVVGAPLKNADGQLVGTSDVQHALDVYGALIASTALPAVLADHVGVDEEGILGFVDKPSQKLSEKFNQRLNFEQRYADAISIEAEEALSEALGFRIPEDTELAPLAPDELLMTLPLFLAEAAGMAGRRAAGGPGLLKRGQRLAGQVVGVPMSVLRFVNRRSQRVAQNLWRLEDLAVSTGKLAVKVARKAIRPILVGYVLHRALTTIDNSRSMEVRMAKLPPGKALDLYYRNMLGDDYGRQIEQDLVDAVKEVEEGLLTDDYKDEKRLLTAAMLRRLEVEEWDKERMKHFYLGSYGLGPWYFDMEERLHNPYFIGARAWNGPIEGWVGKNKTYENDLPLSANKAESAIRAIENALGKKLTYEQKARVLASEQPRASDILTAPGGLLHGVLDKQALTQPSL